MDKVDASHDVHMIWHFTNHMGLFHLVLRWIENLYQNMAALQNEHGRLCHNLANFNILVHYFEARAGPTNHTMISATPCPKTELKPRHQPRNTGYANHQGKHGAGPSQPCLRLTIKVKLHHINDENNLFLLNSHIPSLCSRIANFCSLPSCLFIYPSPTA